MGLAPPNLKQLANVSAIVVGVMIATFGEIRFVWIGFLYQLGGLMFEAIRLNLVQALLSSAEYKMDPLVSLYYFAPICAVMNGLVALIWEFPKVSMPEVYNVGLFIFFLNGLCAFLLNVSVVFLVSSAHSYVIDTDTNHHIDRQDFGCHHDPLRCLEGCHACRCLYAYLGYSRLWSPGLWLRHCSGRHGLLQAWTRRPKGIRW